MATTTCKPPAEPVLPLVWTVPENVQSRDTFCVPDSHAGAIPAPPLRHVHDAPAARDDSGEQKRDYAWLPSDILRHMLSTTLI